MKKTPPPLPPPTQPPVPLKMTAEELQFWERVYVAWTSAGYVNGALEADRAVLARRDRAIA